MDTFRKYITMYDFLQLNSCGISTGDLYGGGKILAVDLNTYRAIKATGTNHPSLLPRHQECSGHSLLSQKKKALHYMLIWQLV